MNTESAERFRQIDALFEASLDVDPNDRPAFVLAAGHGDAELVASVTRLLEAHDRSAGFLDKPLAEFVPELLVDASPPRSLPDRAGPFRIIRELGHGGMGVVYLAERDDGQVRQRVALKLIRSVGGDIVVRRFLEERRILALLEHPGIARLIDAGVTDDGLPYFAMELVEGGPIDSYCDTRRLSIDKRLDHFAAVCDAVQHAHQHFVIHRDLKPSNILVREDGQLKLLDFGIAKLLDPLQADDGVETRTGLVALTPEYASPEQVRGEPASAATDTYALGVLLYSLLTGRRPHDVRGLSPAELERVVCQVEPARPSATLGGASDDALGRAAARGTTPDRLRRRLRGDLDVIVMKALHKDPSRRYASAAALREDLERWRRGMPVLARPDSTGYRLRKFVRRNPAGMAVLALLVAYAATVTVQRERVRRALTEATLGTERAEQVTDFMLALFEESEAGQTLTDTLTARTILSRGEQRLAEMSGQPALQAQMLEVLGRLYGQLGQNDHAKSLLERALSTRRALYGEQHPDYVATLGSLADVIDRSEDFARVVQLRRQAWESLQRLYGDDDPRVVTALLLVAQAVHQQGDNKAATPLFEHWLAAIDRLPRERTPERATQLAQAADFLQLRGDLARSEALLRESLEIRRAIYGDRHHMVAKSLEDLGSFYEMSHRHERADSLLRQSVEMLRPIYPDGNPQLKSALNEWVTVLEHEGRFMDALPAAREAMTLSRRIYGDSSLDAARSELDLSTALTGTGAYAEAETVARGAIDKLRVVLGAKSAMIDAANVTLAQALRGEGRFPEAEGLLLATFKRFDPPKPITRNWHDAAARALVKLYETQNRPNDAARYRATLDSSRRP